MLGGDNKVVMGHQNPLVFEHQLLLVLKTTSLNCSETQCNSEILCVSPVTPFSIIIIIIIISFYFKIFCNIL